MLIEMKQIMQKLKRKKAIISTIKIKITTTHIITTFYSVRRHLSIKGYKNKSLTVDKQQII